MQRGKTGMKWAKYFLLATIFLSAVSAFVVWRGALTLRQGMADCLVWQGASLTDRFIISPETNRELVTRINTFAAKTAQGSNSIMSGFAILRSFYDGPLQLALLQTSLVNLAQTMEAPKDMDRQSIQNMAKQFFGGVEAKTIAAADWQKVRSQLMEQKICETESSIGFVIPEQIESFRKKIGLKALFDCLAVMKQSITSNALSGEESALDPIIELDKILASAR